MPRPCVCEKYENGPWTEGQCRLCWLYHHDERYHHLWGGTEGPTIVQKALGLGQSALAHARTGFQTVADDVKRARLEVCHSCEHYFNDSCRLCGCNMTRKASWASSKCPLDKWPG